MDYLTNTAVRIIQKLLLLDRFRLLFYDSGGVAELLDTFLKLFDRSLFGIVGDGHLLGLLVYSNIQNTLFKRDVLVHFLGALMTVHICLEDHRGLLFLSACIAGKRTEQQNGQDHYDKTFHILNAIYIILFSKLSNVFPNIFLYP